MPEDDRQRGVAKVEGTDIHPQRVLAVAGAISLTLMLVGIAVWALLRFWQPPFVTGPNAPPGAPSAAPRLQAAPQDERAAYFAEKNKLLDSYAWLDRQHATARIPLGVAMDILAARASPRAPGRQP